MNSNMKKFVIDKIQSGIQEIISFRLLPPRRPDISWPVNLPAGEMNRVSATQAISPTMQLFTHRTKRSRAKFPRRSVKRNNSNSRNKRRGSGSRALWHVKNDLKTHATGLPAASDSALGVSRADSQVYRESGCKGLLIPCMRPDEQPVVTRVAPRPPKDCNQCHNGRSEAP